MAPSEKTSIQMFQGDCLELLKLIPDKSIDMIHADLPYGTTQNPRDVRLDLSRLWPEYERVIKDDGCIALWAQSPYDKILACSNLRLYRYEWIIEKTKATGHLNSKKMPMKAHENILIFYKRLPTYNPQCTTGHLPVHNYTKHTSDGKNYGETKTGISGGGSTWRYPRDVLKFAWDTQTSSYNPTQKPVEACRYFIETYTNPGDLVLDNVMGSGSTAIAAFGTGRNFVGMELDEEMYRMALDRVAMETGEPIERIIGKEHRKITA